tara:strand:- start:661 stop:1419 length:759 start_codon:yes stop_codon:yes gene_type:complete
MPIYTDEMSGLHNFGSTCYVNSIVQVLRYTKPVVADLINETPSNETMKLFLDLLYQDANALPFIQRLKDIGFHPHMQHDAHEFMITVLDKLYESVPNKNPFEGTFETTLTCEKGHTRTVTQPFVSLSINGSVKEGICALEQPEDVECKCEECDLTRMSKQTRVKPGKAICVHLKRFNANQKLTYKIPVLQSWKDYELIATCNHIGCMEGGHYTASAFTDKGWYLFNDEHVTKLNKIPEMSRLPYIMVYLLNE